MKKFDVIVIGGGSGLTVSDHAARILGLRVAVIEEGPLGGTCLNRGCIPSKMLIHSADVVETINNAKLFGITPKGYTVDFPAIVKRVFKFVDEDAASIEKAIRANKNSTLYKARAKFVDKKTLQVGDDTITADKIVIAAGTRPSVPPILGLKDVDYVTSDNVMRLPSQPKSMIIIGGGYIAVELAHFFGTLGTEITIIQRNVRLVPDEDEEIATRFTELFSKKYKVFLAHTATKVSKKGKMFVIEFEKKGGGDKKTVEAEALLVATGRVPNTDILDVAKTGVKINEHGYVDVNEFMETNVPGIYALGDIVGKYLFKHSANLEAEYVVRNMFYPDKKKAIDYWAMPHAIFSSPQIGAVGYNEQELKEKGIEYAVGRYNYYDTGMGTAIEDKEGFVKILVEKGTRKILGCHIMGTEASTLVHEVIVAMKCGDGTIDALLNAVHIHPALSEVVQRAARRVRL